MYRKILIPTDGSVLSDRAVEHGVQLAKAVGADVVVLTATELFHTTAFEHGRNEENVPAFKVNMRNQALGILTDAARRAQAAGVTVHTVHAEEETPYMAVIRIAELYGCDLIAMASHGRRGSGGLLLGSETTKVLTHSKIPVLVVR